MDDTFELTDQEIKSLYRTGGLWAMRFARGIVYFLVSALLLWINTYGLQHGLIMASAIGALAVGAVTVRLSLVAVGILLLMAVIPLPLVQVLAAI